MKEQKIIFSSGMRLDKPYPAFSFTEPVFLAKANIINTKIANGEQVVFHDPKGEFTSSMNISKQKYSLNETEKSYCTVCNEPLFLLSSENGDNEAFFICFDCKEVRQVGVGKIQCPIEKEAVDVISDCYLGAFGETPNHATIIYIYNNLSTNIRCNAKQWGWSDTEVRSQVYVFMVDTKLGFDPN